MKIGVTLLFFGFISTSIASNDLTRDENELEISQDSTRNKKCNHKKSVSVKITLCILT